MSQSLYWRMPTETSCDLQALSAPVIVECAAVGQGPMREASTVEITDTSHLHCTTVYEHIVVIYEIELGHSDSCPNFFLLVGRCMAVPHICAH